MEELFANTIQHGYRSSDGGQVWISIGQIRGGVRMIYEDAAPPFNPLAIDPRSSDPTLDGDNAIARPPGGLGRLLIAGMCKAGRYRHEDSRQHNVIELEFST